MPVISSAHDDWECDHCDVGDGFADMLDPAKQVRKGENGRFTSDVRMLWPAHVEVVPITNDIGGGWEPPSFHERLAETAVKGWEHFRDTVVPNLPRGHQLRSQVESGHAGALNDGFFHWQKRIFENAGNMDVLLDDEAGGNTPTDDLQTSWPEMSRLAEYQRLRKIVDTLSRRYLVRSGMSNKTASNLANSIFNWAAVHRSGEFHGPHTHVGEYHVGVFYARASNNSGKLRFGDPRGHSSPFGRSHLYSPRSGELVFFPSWLSHMAMNTLTDDPDERRVIFSFNIGPVYGPVPCHNWWSDPTGQMQFMRQEEIDLEEMGLL
eukprot:TRINITY_DN9301_c0_g1_i4.p1 TRINITY_DN9301_c0_g1~~TRINITY_DN9301_c0_g1_i4.p1  ORF type:complete len:362 (-),score=41.85 TRINITY_DN9301_c0_g1_i4:72-1034(-)